MKLINHILVFLTTVVLLQSCTSPSSRSNFKFPEVSDTIVVELDYPTNVHGTFTENNKEYYFFGEVNTYKKVSIFDNNWNKQKEISLKRVTAIGYQIASVEVGSKNEIWVLTDYITNKLIKLNDEGKILQTFDLNEIAQNNGLKNFFEFSESTFNGFFHDSSFVFALSPNYTHLSLVYKDSSQLSLSKAANKQMFFEPSHIRLELKDGQFKLERIYLNNDFKTHFKNKNFGGLSYYFFDNNSVIRTDFWWDRMVFHKRKKGNIFTSKHIKSAYTSIGVNELISLDSLGKLNGEQAEKLVNYHFQNAGQVFRMFKDKAGRLHLFIYKAGYGLRDDKVKVATWIWQVYDEDYELIDEKLFENKNVIPAFVLSTKNGVYLMNYDEKTYDPKRKVLLYYPW